MCPCRLAGGPTGGARELLIADVGWVADHRVIAHQRVGGEEVADVNRRLSTSGSQKRLRLKHGGLVQLDPLKLVAVDHLGTQLAEPSRRREQEARLAAGRL